MDRGSVEGALYLLASIGNLFLAMLVIFRSRRAPGALPIALLSLSLFLWDIGECLYRYTAREERRWQYLALVGSSLAPAFLFHFVTVFCRKEDALRRWTGALYAGTALFAASTAGAIVIPALRGRVDTVLWNVAYLVTLFPFLIWSFVLVARRRREVTSVVERNALNFVAVGIAIGALTGLADLTVSLGSPLPYLGHVGSLVCTVVLAVAIFRHRLLHSETPVRRATAILALAAGGVTLTGWLVLLAAPKNGIGIFAIALLLVVGLAIYRLALLNMIEAAERRKRLALVGTMAAGVAHEIRNPLASIKGSAQLVLRELDGAASVNGAREYLALVVSEVDRLNGVIEDFLAYARPREPRLRDASLNDVVEDVVKLQRTALRPGVELRCELDPALPVAQADPELLKQALLNVIKNALDAVGEAGTVTIRTRSMPEAWRWYDVIEVEDSGPGVAAEDFDRVFQPFYTTKARGTGLGLAIASRILEAHGGQIALENARPRGARFSFHIPRRRA